jgi:hypothetical protein
VLPLKDLRHNQIKIRLTDEEYKEVIRLAEIDRVPVAVKCRQLLMLGAEQERANLFETQSPFRTLKVAGIGL